MKKLHLFASILIMAIAMFISYSMNAQSSSNQNPFKICASYADGELQLKCDSGC